MKVHYEITADAIIDTRSKSPGEDVYWSCDYRIKPQLVKLTNADGRYLYHTSEKREVVKICPDCGQDVYKIIVREFLLGIPILWDNTDTELILMTKELNK